MDINRAWKNFEKNVTILAKDSLSNFKLKQHKKWLQDEWSKLLDMLNCSGCRTQVK
jgi:hypothetical protein